MKGATPDAKNDDVRCSRPLAWTGLPPDEDGKFARPGKHAAPMLEEGGEIPEDEAWGITGASTAWTADATAATKAGSSVIVEVGGGTDMATLAATDDTTEGAVVDGKAALEDTKKLADRLLLVSVVHESPSILHKRPKSERTRRKT